MTYVTKADVVAFTGLETSDINDKEVWVANVKTDSFIGRFGFKKRKYYDEDELKVAALLFVCELLAQQGKLHLTVGDITDERLGRIHVKRSGQPMFFFSRGSSGEALGMYDLIPHETYRQQAIKEIYNWMSYPEIEPDYEVDRISMGHDSSLRGYGWDDL
jgi:hypothetical protein